MERRPRRDREREKEFEEETIEEMLVPIFRKGELVYEVPTLKEIIEYSKVQQSYIMEEEKRFNYPHRHYVDLSKKLHELKIKMLKEAEGQRR